MSGPPPISTRAEPLLPSATLFRSELRGLAEPAAIYHPVGCTQCNNQGFKGRTGIYELVRVDETARRMIHEHAGEQALEQQARLHTPGIRADGWRKEIGRAHV